MPAADLDLTDAALQADLAELRGRFPETRALYREVCGLLFFRYGVTPTANKLYSGVIVLFVQIDTVISQPRCWVGCIPRG